MHYLYIEGTTTGIRRHMNSNTWLNEKLWCGGSEYATRRLIIWRFTTQGLVPFLRSHGYTLVPSLTDMSSGIASVLFHNRAHTLIPPYVLTTPNDHSPEQKQHYNHVIDPSRWSSLWAAWSFWEDISLECGLGFYRRLDIEEYCWSQIDLTTSKQARRVEEFMEGDDGSVNPREEYEEY